MQIGILWFCMDYDEVLKLLTWGVIHVNLEQLMNERNYILGELKAYEDLQLALEQIKRFNMENFTETTIKVYDVTNDSEMEEITESVVAIKIDELTDYLLKVSDNINRLKNDEDSETSWKKVNDVKIYYKEVCLFLSYELYPILFFSKKSSVLDQQY